MSTQINQEGDAYCPALNMWCEEAKALVAELERREALLTAVVVARRKWLACTRLPEQDALLEELHAADDALTDAGFPWEQPK